MRLFICALACVCIPYIVYRLFTTLYHNIPAAYYHNGTDSKPNNDVEVQWQLRWNKADHVS